MLTVEHRYLVVYLLQRFLLRFRKASRPFLHHRDMRKDSDALLSHARAITAREEVDAQQTECAYQHQHDAHRNAYRIH